MECHYLSDHSGHQVVELRRNGMRQRRSENGNKDNCVDNSENETVILSFVVGSFNGQLAAGLVWNYISIE